MKKLLNAIKNFIAKIFNGLAAKAKFAVGIGYNITNAIKNFDTKNPQVADIITALIPGDLDDKLKNKLREHLPKIVIQLKLVDNTLGLTDPNEIMMEAIRTLQQINSDYFIREGNLNNLSIIIAQVSADGKLDWNDAAYVLKWFFDNKNK